MKPVWSESTAYLFWGTVLESSEELFRLGIPEVRAILKPLGVCLVEGGYPATSLGTILTRYWGLAITKSLQKTNTFDPIKVQATGGCHRRITGALTRLGLKTQSPIGWHLMVLTKVENYND